jgi:hypothetical protein
MSVESVAEITESATERDALDADTDPDSECISELLAPVSFTRSLAPTANDFIMLSTNRGSFEITLVICSSV